MLWATASTWPVDAWTATISPEFGTLFERGQRGALDRRVIAAQPRLDRGASMVSRRTVDAQPERKGTCLTDAALASDLAWLPREHAPDPATPQNLRREPILPLGLGSIATCQLLCIAPICLYSITNLNRYHVGATTSHSTPSSANCQYTT